MAKTRRRIMKKKPTNTPKECYFCKETKAPSYADISTLQRYITDRGKIVGRARNGLCSKHQKQVTLAIKHARHLALLPFIGRE